MNTQNTASKVMTAAWAAYRKQETRTRAKFAALLKWAWGKVKSAADEVFMECGVDRETEKAVRVSFWALGRVTNYTAYAWLPKSVIRAAKKALGEAGVAEGFIIPAWKAKEISREHNTMGQIFFDI